MDTIRTWWLVLSVGALVVGGGFGSLTRAQTSDRDAARLVAEDLRVQLESAKSVLRSDPEHEPLQQDVEALVGKLDQLATELYDGKPPADLRETYREIQEIKRRLIQYGRVAKGPAPLSKTEIAAIQALLKDLDLYFEKVR